MDVGGGFAQRRRKTPSAFRAKLPVTLRVAVCGVWIGAVVRAQT